jgi:hypothetical protein
MALAHETTTYDGSRNGRCISSSEMGCRCSFGIWSCGSVWDCDGDELDEVCLDELG